MADSGDHDEDSGTTYGAVIYVASMAVVLILSVLANILVIYVIISSKAMRNTTNVFICNLAIADILIAGIVVPQNIHHAMHTSNFVEGDFGCKSTTFLPVLCTANSLYNMVAAAYDKHRAIVNFAAQKLTMSKAYVITAVLWILAVLVAAPTLAEYGLIEVDEELKDSNETTHSEKEDDHHNVQCTNLNQTHAFIIINGVVILTFVFLIPFISISVLYGRIGLFIWRKGHKGRSTVSPQQQHPRTLVSRSVVRVVVMLVVSVTLFVIFRTPYFVIKAALKITRQDGSENALSVLTISLNVFLVSGTAYNIIVYSVFNRRFRRVLVKSLTPCCRRADNSTESSVIEQSVSQIQQPNSRNPASQNQQ